MEYDYGLVCSLQMPITADSSSQKVSIWRQSCSVCFVIFVTNRLNHEPLTEHSLIPK